MSALAKQQAISKADINVIKFTIAVQEQLAVIGAVNRCLLLPNNTNIQHDNISL